MKVKPFFYFSKSQQKYIEIQYFYRKFMFLIFFFSIVISFFAFGTFLVFTEFISKSNYFPKYGLQENVLRAINNGADLRSIKQVFLNRELKSLSSRSFLKNTNEYYSNEVPLSIVLEDIRAGLFLGDKIPDSSMINKIDVIISEHTQINPFDKLNPLQRESFQNIRQKLGGSYAAINLELNKITDELYNKNKLVDEYLGDSRTSFWVSIIGLFISLIIGTYQIVLNKTSKLSHIEIDDTNNEVKLEDT